jgi:hypothetical protein
VRANASRIEKLGTVLVAATEHKALHISVFNGVPNAIREDVLDANLGDVEAVELEELATFAKSTPPCTTAGDTP